MHILNGKQHRYRSIGFWRSQLIWIYTVCKGWTYSGSAGLGLRGCGVLFSLKSYQSYYFIPFWWKCRELQAKYIADLFPTMQSHDVTSKVKSNKWIQADVERDTNKIIHLIIWIIWPLMFWLSVKCILTFSLETHNSVHLRLSNSAFNLLLPAWFSIYIFWTFD